MHAAPMEDLERLERRVHVLEEELINFLEVLMITSDPKTIAAAAQLGLETLRSLEGRTEFRPDFEMEWEVGPDVEIRFEEDDGA